MPHDIVIRGGLVLDGTGDDGVLADVAISGDRIVAVGAVAERGRREIDAHGRIVTPGFVDIHTHYDGQATWDERLTPSTWHGVTTVVMGNCGVGFAPVRKRDREAVIELMEGIEDIPAPCLRDGLRWEWESFPEYLDALEVQPRDADVCAQLPHAPLRVFVMGQRALDGEAADAADIAAMQRLTTQAMAAGAFGFTTSRTAAHRTVKGVPTPTLSAREAELTAIARGMADAGHGQIEFISDWDQPDAESEFAMLRRVVGASNGRNCLFTLNQKTGAQSGLWRDLLGWSVSALSDGLSIRPVTAPRPIGVLLGLAATQHPFAATPTYKALEHLPLAERVARMREPSIRESILGEDPYEGSTFPLFEKMGLDLMFERSFELADVPDYEPDRAHSVTSIARRTGRTPAETAYDLLLERQGHALLYVALTGYQDFNLDVTREMLSHRHVVVGLSDGGAHVGLISDASFPTFLLTHWGRDRASGRFPLAELVRRNTSDPASALGLMDRGLLRPGMKADLNVIDFDQLAVERPYVASDLPGGGRRLLQKARGYDLTMVSGCVTYEYGEPTGALPGRLVRAGRAQITGSSKH